MKLPNGLGHLTYCLNIHATQTFDDVMAALDGPVAAVKAAVSSNASFAVGLRFSGEALDELADEGKLAVLKAALKTHDFQGLTVNGFPYGRFHGTRVKEEVYQPDWRKDERVRYTNALADLMVEIAPDEKFISLSTVPGTFKPLSVGVEAEMADNYLRSVAHMVGLSRLTGCTVALAIEPEPSCFLETIAETIAYFQDYLFCDEAAKRLAELTGLSIDQSREALPRHLGLCYDVCHAAVEYEDPTESIKALRTAGIPVHKLQLSAALRVVDVNAERRDALQSFNEPTYLHQVIRRTPDGLKQLVDLPEALALGAETDGEEWRVHFHVPVFLDDLGAFSSTQDFLKEILILHKAEPISPHLEIETYTWDVLPSDVRGASMDQDVTREIQWVLEQLTT